MSFPPPKDRTQVVAAVQTVERRLFEHLRSRIEEPGLSGVLTREGRARQEREAERGVRAVCSVGALPGGMGGAAASAALCACTRVYNPLRTNHRQPVD